MRAWRVVLVREIAVVGPATGMSKDLKGELRNLARREPEVCVCVDICCAGVSEREGNGGNVWGRDNGGEVVDGDGDGGSFDSCVRHEKGDIHDLGN